MCAKNCSKRGSSDKAIAKMKRCSFFASHGIYRWAKKLDHFYKCITFSYNDIGRRSIYQNVQLFIRSNNDILNAAAFKYSLHR